MLIMGSKAVGAGNVQAEIDEIVLQGALTAATGTTVGGVLKLKNDFGIDLIVTDVFIDIKTKAGAAALESLFQRIELALLRKNRQIPVRQRNQDNAICHR